MDCERALILISAALDGELSREEQAELEEHLAACPECRALSDDFGVMSVALSDMQAEPPDDLMGRVEAALDQEAVSVTARPKPRWKAWGSLAAMLALVVCLGGVYLWSGMGGMAGAGADSAAPAQSSQIQSEAAESGGAAAADEPSLSRSEDFVTGEEPAVYDSADAEEAENAAEGQNTAEDQNTADADPSQPVVGSEDVSSETENGVSGFTTGNGELAPADEPPVEADAPLAPPPAPSTGPNALTVAPAMGDESAKTEELTPLQALEMVFSALGGSESYPNAELRSEDPARYFLTYEETEDTQTSLMLEYSGLSSNGLYHIIREYEYIVEDGANGWVHTATVNRYAVSLDGSGVMAEYDAEGSEATAQAFRDAVDG